MGEHEQKNSRHDITLLAVANNKVYTRLRKVVIPRAPNLVLKGKETRTRVEEMKGGVCDM